jgi:hypothetical protein
LQARTKEEEARLEARGSIISSELRKIENMCCCGPETAVAVLFAGEERELERSTTA